MRVQAEPSQLRFMASWFSSGSQVICQNANRIERIMNELLQGSWKGEGAQAFAVQCEVMIGELQKASDVLDTAADTLNRFAYRMERVNQLRNQAYQMEQQMWECDGDSIDSLHARQNLARQVEQALQEAEWEANAADAQATNEFNRMLAMIPQIVQQMNHYLGGCRGTGDLNELPEPIRGYYLRHKELLNDGESETASALAIGSNQQEETVGAEDDHWYDDLWDWLKREGREYKAISIRNGPTDDFAYNEFNHWTFGLPETVKRVFHTKPFSLENWEANLDLFLSVVPAMKVESGAFELSQGTSTATEGNLDSTEMAGGQSIEGLEIVDGKVMGKVPLEDFKSIRIASIHNPDADSIVLGKYTPTYEDGVANWGIPGPDSYISKAGTDSTYFSLGNEWGKIQDSYGLTNHEMFELFNAPALDDAVSSGKTIKFSHKPTLEIYKNSFLADEWNYLKSKYGFKKLVEVGGFWIAK